MFGHRTTRQFIGSSTTRDDEKGMVLYSDYIEGLKLSGMIDKDSEPDDQLVLSCLHASKSPLRVKLMSNIEDDQGGPVMVCHLPRQFRGLQDMTAEEADEAVAAWKRKMSPLDWAE